MEPDHWIPLAGESVLDVGCNVGDLLAHFRQISAEVELAGVDLSHGAIEIARRRVPSAEILQALGQALPFADARFDWVTCIEVIEHVPAEHRGTLLSEIRRVLRPGGALILRCPHAGTFSWLDPQNFRFRLPTLYRSLVQRGRRDAEYEKSQEQLIWHHHFTRDELLGLAGDGWTIERCEFGGLALLPLSDILRWPFYRRNRSDHWIARALNAMARIEYDIDFGERSFGILMILRKL